MKGFEFKGLYKGSNTLHLICNGIASSGYPAAFAKTWKVGRNDAKMRIKIFGDARPIILVSAKPME
jgi:hypothetical protein